MFNLQEAIETMVTCSAMAIIKEQESNKEETQGKGSKWAKLKRGGIIGAAAITGGTLLAITGGAETLIYLFDCTMEYIVFINESFST
jgi:hypothetical protein